MSQSLVRLAALGFLALGVAVAAARAEDSPAAAAASPAQQHVMMAYRIVKAEPDFLVDLGVERPEAGETLSAPGPENTLELDVLIANLEDARKVRLVSRPMVMVQTGEKAEIESGHGGGGLRLTMRAAVKGESVTADLALALSSVGGEPMTIERDGLELPASIVRCADEGECVVVFVHAHRERATEPSLPE